MEYSWLQIFSSLLVFNRTDEYSWIYIFSLLIDLNNNDSTWVGIFQKRVYIYLLSNDADFILVF